MYTFNSMSKKSIFMCINLLLFLSEWGHIYGIGFNLLGMEAVCDHFAFFSLFFSYLSIKAKARNMFISFTLSRCPLITFTSCRNRRIFVNEKCPLPASGFHKLPDRTWNVTQMHITTSELRCAWSCFCLVEIKWRMGVNAKCPLTASITWSDRTWNATQIYIMASELRLFLK